MVESVTTLCHTRANQVQQDRHLLSRGVTDYNRQSNEKEDGSQLDQRWISKSSVFAAIEFSLVN